MKLVYGPWVTIYYCHGCGKHAVNRYELDPCPTCGEHDYSTYTARTFKLSFFRKLLNLCMLKASPSDGWEYKDGTCGRDYPPIPKHNRHLSRARMAQLELQTELIELLPDKFDVYLEHDKVLIKRVDERMAYDPLSMLKDHYF